MEKIEERAMTAFSHLGIKINPETVVSEMSVAHKQFTEIARKILLKTMKRLADEGILIGGSSINKANIFNVIVGTFLFQGIITMTPIVISGVIETDMPETIRVIISNGMILYALIRKGESN